MCVCVRQTGRDRKRETQRETETVERENGRTRCVPTTLTCRGQETTLVLVLAFHL